MNPQQLYVIRSPKDGTTYIFDNHEAALACRHDLKLDHHHLIGQSIVHSQWPPVSPRDIGPAWRDWPDRLHRST